MNEARHPVRHDATATPPPGQRANGRAGSCEPIGWPLFVAVILLTVLLALA